MFDSSGTAQVAFFSLPLSCISCNEPGISVVKWKGVEVRLEKNTKSPFERANANALKSSYCQISACH
jgi:hypothetical protein